MLDPNQPSISVEQTKHTRHSEPFAKAICMMFLVSEVHPFNDGNGRVARVTMNAELSSQDYQRLSFQQFTERIIWSVAKINETTYCRSLCENAFARV